MDAFLAAHPEDIYRACDELFKGQEWLAFEPETLLLELGNDIADAAVDKLLAVQAAASATDVVCTSAAAFEKTVTAFNNGICVMDVLQPPEVEEMSYAVSQIGKIVRLAHGPDKAPRYSGEVPGYVAAVARFRGWFMLPKNLSFAQEMLDVLTGMTETSKRREQCRELRDAVTELVSGMTRADARDILGHDDVKALEKDDMASQMVRRFIGALLYDPTLPHRTHAAAHS